MTGHTQVCPGLVEQVEADALNDDQTLAMVRRFLQPLLDAGVDALVLGCTHYPFSRAAITHIAGPLVAIIDPAPAVARQTAHVLACTRPDVPHDWQGQRTLYTSGDNRVFRQSVERLIGGGGDVRAVRWSQDLNLALYGEEDVVSRLGLL